MYERQILYSNFTHRKLDTMTYTGNALINYLQQSYVKKVLNLDWSILLTVHYL